MNLSILVKNFFKTDPKFYKNTGEPIEPDIILGQYFKIKDYENTKIFLEKNLSVDPKQEQSEKMLGDIYRKMGNSDMAFEHYNKAIAINENYSKAHYSLGSILLNSRKLEEARVSFNKATMIDPEYAKAYGALGKVDYEMTESKKKSRQFSRSLFIINNVKKGEVISNTNIRSIRPGFGLHPKELPYILGKKFSKDQEKGTPLNWNMIQ